MDYTKKKMIYFPTSSLKLTIGLGAIYFEIARRRRQMVVN